MEENGKVKGALAENVSQKAKERCTDQIGTLGSGNHYCEVQKIEKIFTSRWPETSRVAIKSKLKMEELLRESENNIFNPELPNTKEEICSACEIKLCNLGDFKNWLKTYRYDFYIKFIEDFPGFGGRK